MSAHLSSLGASRSRYGAAHAWRAGPDGQGCVFCIDQRGCRWRETAGVVVRREPRSGSGPRRSLRVCRRSGARCSARAGPAQITARRSPRACHPRGQRARPSQRRNSGHRDPVRALGERGSPHRLHDRQGPVRVRPLRRRDPPRCRPRGHHARDPRSRRVRLATATGELLRFGTERVHRCAARRQGDPVLRRRLSDELQKRVRIEDHRGADRFRSCAGCVPAAIAASSAARSPPYLRTTSSSAPWSRPRRRRAIHSPRSGRSPVVVDFVVTAWVLASAPLGSIPEVYHTNPCVGDPRAGPRLRGKARPVDDAAERCAGMHRTGRRHPRGRSLMLPRTCRRSSQGVRRALASGATLWRASAFRSPLGGPAS